MKDELSGLDKAIGAILGQRTIERNQLLVKIAKSKLNKVRDDKNEKLTKPEELVRLYDLLLQVTIFECCFLVTFLTSAFKIRIGNMTRLTYMAIGLHL